MINQQNRQCTECYKIECNSECSNYIINKELYSVSSVVFQYLPHNSEARYLNKRNKLEKD